MQAKLLTKFFLVVAICVGSALSSAYYNNEYFERISKNEVNEHWTADIDAHSFIKDTFSCEHIHRYNRKPFITIGIALTHLNFVFAVGIKSWGSYTMTYSTQKRSRGLPQ